MVDSTKTISKTVSRVCLLIVVIQLLIMPSRVFCEEVAKVVNSVTLGSEAASSGDTPLPDLFTGTMSYHIPIEVPPGRNGMEPELVLSYNSRSDDGWLGMGWDLEVGSIERSTRAMVNYYGDAFVLRRDGSISELVKLSTGEFRSKIESDFMRIQKQANGAFVATDKSGVKYFFGESENSRISRTIGQTFRWALNRIVDTSGNEINVTYQNDNNGQIYLDRIDYNGNVIKFYVENRPDTTSLYGSSFLIKTTKRLRSIGVIGANGSPIGAYKLTYQQGNNSNRSLLNEVTRFGKNATVDVDGVISDSTSVPIQLFKSADYGDVDDNSFLRTESPSGIGNWTAYKTQHFIGDFNGDGKSDILKLQTDDNNELLLSNGDGSFSSFAPLDSNGVKYSGWLEGTPTVLLGDFNGDRNTDILIMKRDGTNNIYCYTKDGKFDVATSPLGSLATWQEPTAKLVGDFDGDGKDDVVLWRSDGNIKVFETKRGSYITGGPSHAWTSSDFLVGNFVNSNGCASILLLQSGGSNKLVIPGDGSGYGYIPVSSIDTVGWGDVNVKVVTGDFNGDGVTDFMRFDNNSVNSILYTSNNDGTFTKITVQNVGNSSSTDTALYYAADFNGDGKSDILKGEYGILPELFPILTPLRELAFNNSAIYMSNGDNTFSTNSNNLNLIPSWCTYDHTAILIGDYIGNGKNSILAWAPTESVLLTRVKTTPLDTLKSLSNYKGGTVSIDYTASTTLTNNRIPFPIWLPTLVTANDGNGNVSQESYIYANGYYNSQQHDFRGFNHVTVTGPLGSSGERKVTETWFHQGNDLSIDVNDPNIATGYMMGKPYRVRITDGDGHTFSETETTYADDKDKAAPWFNPPAQVDTYICDGSVIGQCKGADNAKYLRTNYLYDYENDYPTVHEYGNLSYEYRYGDDSVANDDLTIYRTYSTNETDWIVGLTTSEGAYNGIGTSDKIALKTFYYDGVTGCDTLSSNQRPIKGLLTGVVNWLKYENEPEADVEIRMAYDSYGNQICSRDPLGYTTKFLYDPSNTFRIKTTNHLGHEFHTAYYGVDGVDADKGVYGQVKRVTDPNGAATTREYDDFGRPSKEIQADGTWTSWDYKYDGIVGSQRVLIDTSNSLWSEDYMDGFGRTILNKKIGPMLKIIATNFRFDARGAVRETTFPFFYGYEWPRYVRNQYDPIGRVVETGQVDANHIRTLTCYDKEATVTIDPNNHRRREVRDALGRLIKVQEYTDTFNSCTTEEGDVYATTTYQYDVLGNLRFVKDEKLNETEIRYDSLGRKRYMRDPDMGVWTYKYDLNGNLLSQTDANLQTINFSYDELNRLGTKRHGTSLVLTNYYDDVVPGYFNKGRLTKMTDSSGQTVYNYDSMGRVTSTAKTVDGTTYTLGASFSDGRLKSITYPDDETVIYYYDEAGNLEGVIDYVNFSDFDALGRPWSALYNTSGAGSMSDYAYDPVTKRLNRIRVQSLTEGVLFDNSYDGYDNKGNITSITDNLNQPLDLNFSSETYTPVRAHAVASTGSGRVFSYDDNGNITDDGLRTLVYNYDNMPISWERKVSISTKVNNVIFTYDGNGTRVKKSSPVSTTVYIDKLYECTKSNGSTNSICGKYIFAGDTRVALKNGNQTLFYHPDHQGSTSVVTDLADNKVEEITYYPFGDTRQKSGSTAVNHMYTGQEQDSETDLYNYNARLYDPDLGRFMTPDSIVPDPEEPQSFNRYSYVRNNPINMVDPTGHAEALYFFAPASDYGSGTSSGTSSGTQYNTPGQSTAIETDALNKWLSEEAAPFIRGIGRGIKKLFGGGRHRDAPPPPAFTRTNVGTSTADRGIYSSLLNEAMRGNGADIDPIMLEEQVLNMIPLGGGFIKATNLHHSFAKFLGGNPRQALTKMSKSLHVELHKDLIDFLMKNYPNMVPKAGYPGAKMRSIIPKDQRINALSEFYTGVGVKYNKAAKDFFDQIK